MPGPLPIRNGQGHFCKIPKISNFGDNSLDNTRDKG